MDLSNQTISKWTIAYVRITSTIYDSAGVQDNKGYTLTVLGFGKLAVYMFNLRFNISLIVLNSTYRLNV